MDNPQFAVGIAVQMTNQPESVGIVKQSRWNEQIERWDYIILFGTERRGVPEGALQALVEMESPWEALVRGSVSGREHFVSTLTYERLAHPPARIAHSFATARTRFYPYQFKPLLKFLEHPGKRLLIADDVGLGKTIEAGYILRELDAHRKAERVLVLAPARLASKWKGELESRFDERFEIVKGSDLFDQATRMERGQDADPFRWIVSYESVRSEEITAQLQKTQLPLDLLIADEAHRMRNPKSLQHRIGAVLSKCADAAVFLSATPVMNRLEDLWHLLRLLSPEEFSVWEIFNDRIQTNRLILAAQRELSSTPPRLAEAHNYLTDFGKAMEALGEPPNEFTESVLNRLKLDPISRRDLLEIQADVCRMSPTSHVISRTRKADAMPDRPQRDVGWEGITLSDIEAEIYNSVEALCRETGVGGHSGWGFEMALLTAYRAVASCIPAAIEYFAEKLKQNAALDIDDFEEEREEFAAHMTPWTGSVRARFAEIVELSNSAEFPDSKLAVLTSILHGLWKDDDERRRPRRKIVVFSFFRGTLRYLSRQLDERNIHNRVIHGGISIPDRERAVTDFLTEKNVPVLLSSEVGGEGIDLIEASVVVNYDLPWNPMVVEQRIGRVDRIGQQAERIIVRNLVVKGSVEERVLSRLLLKIGVFLETIGDLEPIVGDEIENLTRRALRGELNSEEIERQVAHHASVLDKTRVDATKMLTQADGLLAADQALVDEIEALIGERQIPAEEEVFLFLNRFLQRYYPGSQLPVVCLSDVTTIEFSGELATDMQGAGFVLGNDILEFGRRISTGTVDLTLSRNAAYKHPRAQLVQLQHPLCRFSIWKLKQAKDQMYVAFALSIPKSAELPPGDYAFLIASADIHAQRPVTRLVSIVMNRSSGELFWNQDQTKSIVVTMLRDGQDLFVESLAQEECNVIERKLQSGLQQLLAEWEMRESSLDRAREQRLRAAQLSVFQFRRQRAEERVQNLKRSGAPSFPVRMAEAKLANEFREASMFEAKPIESNWRGIENREVAVGLLKIGGC
jgi:SNF2 family DNA or RNA helicase